MTFNVEAFIKERTQYWHLMDRKVMALDDVLYLAAQLLPPGHVVVPREDLQAIIQSLIPNELSAARRKALRRLESLLMPLIASSGPSEISDLLTKAESALRTIVASGEATDFQISTFNELKRHIDGPSSGPEQPKCGGKGYTHGYTSGGRDSIFGSFPCPGCPDCASPKDSAAISVDLGPPDPDDGLVLLGASPQPVAQETSDNEFLDIPLFLRKHCDHHRAIGLACKHCPGGRACHTPAPAAKEVNHD